MSRGVSITALMGFDDACVHTLSHAHVARLVVVAWSGVLSVALAAFGLGYAAHLALGGVVVPVAIALCTALFVWNLVRLHHAGAGFPAHRPLDELHRHRAAPIGVVVFFAIGAMTTTPCAMWVLAPLLARDVATLDESAATGSRRVHDDGAARVVDARSLPPPRDGLIARGRAFAARPVPAALLIALFSSMFAAVAWLKQIFVAALRAYELARNVRERASVEDEFAHIERVVADVLAPYDTFSGTLRRHFADPPYHTVPLFFGVDRDSAIEHARFVRPWDIAPDEQSALEPVIDAPPVVEEPPGDAPPVEEKPPTASPVRPASRLEEAPVVDESALGGAITDESPAGLFDGPLPDDDGTPPHVAYLDIGRLPAARARRHADVIAPFVAALTGRGEREVAALLRVAPDDVPVHRLFSEYTSLRSILMREAGFAHAHGFERLVSIVVGLPIDDVRARMANAPPDMRLTGVFAPELARRILRARGRR